MIEYLLNLIGLDPSIVSCDGAFFIASITVVTSFVFLVKGIFSFFNSMMTRY